MVTVERTEDAVVLKLPSTTTEAQLRAMLRVYEESQPTVVDDELYESLGLPAVPEGEYDPEVGKVAVALGRLAKQGAWERVKDRFKAHPEYKDLLKTAGEEE